MSSFSMIRYGIPEHEWFPFQYYLVYDDCHRYMMSGHASKCTKPFADDPIIQKMRDIEREAEKTLSPDDFRTFCEWTSHIKAEIDAIQGVTDAV